MSNHDLEAQRNDPYHGNEVTNFDEIGSGPAPDNSQRQELLDQSAASNSLEEISRVAATLYLEMKKAIKARNH